MKKRISACIVTTICFMLMISSLVYANNYYPADLTIIMEYDNKPLQGIGLAICQVAIIAQENNDISYSVAPAFSGLDIDFSDLSDEKNIALAAVLNTYASNHNIARTRDVTDSGGKVTFHHLQSGLYLVAQTDSEYSEYIIAPYLISVVSMFQGQDDKIISYPKSEPVRLSADLISVSVQKIWTGTDNIPASVLVQLYCDGTPYGNAVILNAENNWRHTWNNLDSDATWSVDELDVPQGYTKSISGNADSGFVITNTKTPASVPNDNSRPNTGDDNNILLGILCVLLSTALLAAVIRKSKSK